MKKLIKADLSKVLELTAAYQPINCDSLKAELEILAQNGYSDDLFLARKDRFRLMALSEVYTVGSDANRLRDVVLFDRLPNTQRERHIKQMISRCLRYAPQCTMMELIEYLKTGRCN